MSSLLVADRTGREDRVVLEPTRRTVLGRDATCAVVVGHPSVSRRHASIGFVDGGFTVEDLSTNGLFVNGDRVRSHRLGHGDLIVLGAADRQPIRFSTQDTRLEAAMTRGRNAAGSRMLDDIASLRKLVEVNNAITTSLEPEEVFELLLEGILEIAAGSRALILLKGAGDEMEVVFEKNLECESSFAGEGISDSVVRRVVTEGKPLLINDVADAPDFEAQASIQALDLRSIVAIPLNYSPGYLRNNGSVDSLMGVVYVDSRSARRRFERGDLDLMLAFAAQGSISLENAKLHRDLQENYLELVMSLAEAVEIKDRYTRGHSDLVSRYAVAIAERLDLTPAEIEMIRRGGMLHDVGKIGIDESILNKNGPLTDAEFAEIKRHPVYGAGILAPIGSLRGEREIVLQHHEKMDGSGYPHGLSGDEISLGARIIAVCDVYEGVTSNRPYRKPMKPREVVRLLEQEAVDKLDPEIVEAFLAIYKEADFKKGGVATISKLPTPADPTDAASSAKRHG